MPSFIAFGVVNQNAPAINAALFMGEGNVGGWDANLKFNAGRSGIFGFFNNIALWTNINIDNMEVIDGAINDQDLKPTFGLNV